MLLVAMGNNFASDDGAWPLKSEAVTDVGTMWKWYASQSYTCLCYTYSAVSSYIPVTCCLALPLAFWLPGSISIVYNMYYYKTE